MKRATPSNSCVVLLVLVVALEAVGEGDRQRRADGVADVVVALGELARELDFVDDVARRLRTAGGPAWSPRWRT
jgi:hypothetical protein